MKKVLRSLTTSLLSFAVFLSAASPAQAQTMAWSGVCVDGPDGDVATIQGLECLLANVFTVFISLIGLAGFVMFIVAAFTWMLSGSDTKGVTKAQGTMTNAVIGLVISLSAFIILNLIASFTGVSLITEFRIPDSTEGL